MTINKRLKEITKHLFGKNIDAAVGQRINEYVEKKWFCPATPILHNSGTPHGLPISCFVNHVGDTMDSIQNTYNEVFCYAKDGGGVGTYWGDVRHTGAVIREKFKHSGVIPFMKVQDSMALAVNQSGIRNGSTAVYLNVWHPDIEVFLEMRRVTGGDYNRRCLNLHHGVIIDDAFMHAVEKGESYSLRDKKGDCVRAVNARELWQKILVTRIETGEPFIVFIDTVNKALPVINERWESKVYTSNLCSEILQPTSPTMPAVCCLGSLNLEKWHEYEQQIEQVVMDCLEFLDKVLIEFWDKVEDNKDYENTLMASMAYRNVGLGVMGFHAFLQNQGLPFACVMSKVWNKRIFETIRGAVEQANTKLGYLYGYAPATINTVNERRFTFAQAIAPTATISLHMDTTPSIDPVLSNVFIHKTQKGNVTKRNKNLEHLLQQKLNGDVQDIEKVWDNIQANGGSVYDVTCLSDDEKAVYKTAFEIDQRWIIDLASDRAPFIDQGQSVNLFFASDVDKKYLLECHMNAWRGGVKSLYYCRSSAMKRAQVVGQETYKECLACQ